MNFQTSEVGYIAGTPYVGATVDMYAGPGGHRGEFMAWDPVKRKKVWSITEKFPVWSGALVTAGDVAFYGTMDRWFKAVDAKTGKVLWQFHAGSGFIGQPVTFMGNDGVQYVAILSGVGGWPGVVASGRDRSARAQRRARLHRRDAGSSRTTPSAATACWCLRCGKPQSAAATGAADQAAALRQERAHDRATQARRARAGCSHRSLRCGACRCAAAAPPTMPTTSSASAPIPTTCRSRIATATASRTSSPSSSPASSAQHVAYTWWAQRRGFIRNTLKAGDCDVVMGVPARLDMVETTRPYYRSTYVFVSRADRALCAAFDQGRASEESCDRRAADRRRRLQHAARACAGRAGDRPQRRRLHGLRRLPADQIRRRASSRRSRTGEIDVAAVWGPLAGYFAQRSPVPLTLTPISDTADFSPLLFQFDIAIGVRKGDHARKAAIDDVLGAITGRRSRVCSKSYGVPLAQAATKPRSRAPN